jgi:hypothetical protein
MLLSGFDTLGQVGCCETLVLATGAGEEGCCDDLGFVVVTFFGARSAAR